MLTTSECARWAGLNPSTVRRAILRGDLPAQKKGKTWLVSRRDFEQWLNNATMHKTGKKG